MSRETMNLRKFRGEIIACFSKKEIEAFMLSAMFQALSNEMANKHISFQDLKDDFSRNTLDRIKNITSGISNKIAEDKDEHEIFFGAFILLDFYEDKSEVCFELKGEFNPSKDSIRNLDDLTKFREEATDIDCIIKTKEVFRPFQLKRYRGSLNSQELCKFITAKVTGYAKTMGTNNLLVVLQSPENDLDRLDWNDLHGCLKNSSMTLNGQILIAYNQANQTSVINQVFPDLATSRVPIQWKMGRPPDTY